MNPFAWLRRRAAEAVALGVADGLAALTPEGEDPPPDLAGLRQLAQGGRSLPPAASAPPEEDSPRKGRARA